ncbi:MULTISPECIES: DUF397 domain-containing protein [unclassified Spirillospora]|uniref:DUF397 domain-containing protein n=1 Tax=unclassified Spirillospora TaxID=2642701 RepID=UPI0037240581
MTTWRKSSHSGGMNDDACVEVAQLGDRIGVRDSKNPDGERLGLGSREFSDLVIRIKLGEFALRR